MKQYLFVAAERTSKFALLEVPEKSMRRAITDFLVHFIGYGARKVHTAIADNGSDFATPDGGGSAIVKIKQAMTLYARAYLNSQQRARELPFFMHRYNWHRPHASIGAKPPISTLGLTEDNLLRLHT